MAPFQSAACVSVVPLEPALLPVRPLRAVLAVLHVWMKRSRQRRALADLEDHHLKDIGKTHEQALAEARKPFWRA